MDWLSKKVKLFLAFVVGMVLSVPSYALDVVTKDATTGEVSFDPAVIVDPVTTAIITTICSVAGIFLIVLGARWVFRLCRGR
ncbi:MAG: hypothetical protein PHH77_02305 [Victivallaceae bacterium]|nr:hypothetical protein [Victivallaceae bacterium]MDD5697424.1 hypothetical protein [Victivallaceae bacterium]